jgi:hypothetical protein
MDVTVDGADGVDPDLDMIKGYGAPRLERIVARRRATAHSGRPRETVRSGAADGFPSKPFALPFVTRSLLA